MPRCTVSSFWELLLKCRACDDYSATGVVSFALVAASVNAAKQRTIVVTAIFVATSVGFDCRSKTGGSGWCVAYGCAVVLAALVVTTNVTAAAEVLLKDAVR